MRDPFFVVTTGRSGSVSLALTLSQHPLICALHEPWQYLIELSWKRLAGQAPGPGSAVGMFRQWVPVPAGVQMCGVVDQKLAAFIPDLAEAFPKGRFIWLVRDGRSVVASGYERGWYQGSSQKSVGRSQKSVGRSQSNPWEVWRWTGPAVVSPNGVPAMHEEEWEGLGAFGRNCWYWAWVNGMIKRELDRLVREREAFEYYTIRLEQAADPGELERLVEWLGMPVVDGMEMVRSNRGPGRMRWDTWSGGQRAVFGEMCGEMMGSLGYPLD